MLQLDVRRFAAALLITTSPLTALGQAVEQESSLQPYLDAPAVAKPAESSSCLDMALQQQLEDLQARSKHARNALIGTSAAVGVGIAFIVIGNSQCQLVTRIDGENDLICNTAGNVLWGLGMGMSISAAVGVITSGIILGVANKRKRKIQRDIRNRYSARRLHWDAHSGGFVF